MRRLDLLPSGPFFPTASELRRAAECVAPWALGLPESEDAPSEWAESGRKMHAWAESIASRHRSGIPIDELRGITSSQQALVDMVFRDGASMYGKPESLWFVEQGIKWRPGVLEDEAALCERKPGERLQGWFSGTVDLAYVRHDSVLVIADWKFGPREHVTGEPAKDSCQGFFLALAVCTALGITGSSDAVVVTRFERRLVSEEGIEVDAHDITWGELCAWRDVLEGLARRITSAVDAAPKLSAACGHCKAKAECPAWDQLNGTVADAIVASRGERSSRMLFDVPETDDDLRTIHFAIEAGETWLAERKRLREAYVLTHDGGVIVGLGLKLKAIPSKDREVLDTPEALDAIERIVPGAIVVERKAGIGTITKAVGDNIKKENEAVVSPSRKNKTKVAELERVFGELAAAGAVVDKGKRLTVRTVRSDEKEY